MARIEFEDDVDPIAFFYALRFVGLPYIWGGNSPADGGFDCSGLVLEILRARGLWDHGSDTTAQGIYNHFADGQFGVCAISPRFGALVFYGKSFASISHVAFGIGGDRVIDSGGGGSNTRTPEDAARDNAYVRIRRFDYRSDLVAIVLPHPPSYY